MTKKIFRLLTLFACALITIPVQSEEIKLMCNIVLERQENGEKNSKNISIVVEVIETKSFLGIIPQGDELVSASTSKSENTIDIKNYSTLNKWDISKSNRYPDGAIMEVKFIIDRNLGRISYSYMYKKNNYFANEIANGSCEKAQQARKF